MKRAAVYLRVSTAKQTVENQRSECERLARARGFEELELYEETESAVRVRPVYSKLLSDARAHRFAAVVVWSLDRLHRSMQGAVADVLELDRIGVRVLSVREDFVDTTGPTRSLMVAIFGWVAEQERSRLIERTRAGMDRARAQGKRVGRPRASPVLLGSAADLVERGVSIRAAAKRLGIPKSALHRFLQGSVPKGP